MPKPTATTKPKDTLSWWGALITVAALALPIVYGRHHTRTLIPLGLIAAVLLLAPITDRIQGAWRARCGTLGNLTLIYLTAIVWPWGGWALLIPPALLVYATIEIGSGRGSNKRAARKVEAGLVPTVQRNAPPGTKVHRAKHTGKTATVAVDLPESAKDIDIRNLAGKIANNLGVPRSHVQYRDLGEKVKAGHGEIVLRTGRPFDFPMPPIPPVGEWPAGSFPLGVDADSEPVWMKFATMDHILVSGRTRWGKSNTLWIILIGILRAIRGVEFIMIDPKGGAELGMWRPWCSAFARTPAEGKQVLRDLVARMDARYAAMDTAGQRKSTMWPIVCVIDEAAQVLDDRDARALSLKLAQMALAANIHIIYATQYPTDDLFGSALKQNISTVITHRLKDSTGSNVAVGQGAKGDGWDASKLEKPGRAIVEMPHLVEPRIKVQVFQAPDSIPDDLPAPPTTPTTPPTSRAATQGQQPVVTVVTPPTTGHPTTDQNNGGRYRWDDRVEAALSDEPITGRAIYEALGCALPTVQAALKRLETRGRATQVPGGWISTLLDQLAYDITYNTDDDTA